jgi:hypothetical protein
MQESVAFTWREVVEKHHTALLGELKERLEAELAEALSRAVADERSEADSRVAKSREEARTLQAESLNQVLRRLRSTSEKDIPGLIAQGVAPYAAKLVVLLFESGAASSDHARVAASYGIAQDTSEVSVDINASLALASAVETKDPVTALATAVEISGALAPLLSDPNCPPEDQRAYLFPVIVRQSVTAMLIATAVEMSAPIELLCEAAGMRFESFAAPAAALVTVAAAPVAAATSALSSQAPAEADRTRQVPASATSVSQSGAPQSWDDLTPEDQKLHLQAQRMARVRVAEMRLYQPNELRSGVEGSNIYGALQSEIDTARTQFLQNFLSKSPTMVDYLHLEIMRSLAHEDDHLLGHGYPGPMV